MADESSFSTRVHVIRWQNGQSIHLGWSLRASSGVTVAGAVAAGGGWLVAVAFSGTGSGGICTGGASGLSIVRTEDRNALEEGILYLHWLLLGCGIVRSLVLGRPGSP